jgi:hypothetical protein
MPDSDASKLHEGEAPRGGPSQGATTAESRSKRAVPNAGSTAGLTVRARNQDTVRLVQAAARQVGFKKAERRAREDRGLDDNVVHLLDENQPLYHKPGCAHEARQLVCVARNAVRCQEPPPGTARLALLRPVPRCHLA